jgi:choice-of-anchor B domain-containing protein
VSGCQRVPAQDGDDSDGSSETTGGTDETGDDSEESDSDTGPEDQCPDDPDKFVPGLCGCGVEELDDDDDQIVDCVDLCPGFYDPNQQDTDEDGLGNACDPCPADENLDCSCVDNAATCEDGVASNWTCDGIDLLHFRNLSSFGGSKANDVWAWVDPATDREYALVGLDIGVGFMDVTDVACPTYLGLLPSHSVNSGWRDMKTYEDHVYVVSEAEGAGLQVFDLTQLPDVAETPTMFEETAHHDGFENGHNLYINEASATAYVIGGSGCGGGLYMLDLTQPTDPNFVGCFDDISIHDAQCVNYVGPDTEHDGKEICVTSNGSDLSVGVVDVTDKENPVELSRTGYSGAFYSHSGWLTEDHTYFFHGDEGDEIGGANTTTFIWDMTDLDAPQMIGTYVFETMSTDHNLYVLGSRLYEVNYSTGLRILDTSDVANANLTELGWFDTFPADDEPGYAAAWGMYPFLPSGNILVTDNGLFVVKPNF